MWAKLRGHGACADMLAMARWDLRLMRARERTKEKERMKEQEGRQDEQGDAQRHEDDRPVS